MLRPRGRFPSRDATPVPCRRASAPDRRERRLGVARDLGPSLPLADPGLPLAPQVEAVRPIGRNDSPRFRPGLASDPGCGACFASDAGSERPRAPSFPRFPSRSRSAAASSPLQQRLRGRLVAACFAAGSSPGGRLVAARGKPAACTARIRPRPAGPPHVRRPGSAPTAEGSAPTAAVKPGPPAGSDRRHVRAAARRRMSAAEPPQGEALRRP